MIRFFVRKGGSCFERIQSKHKKIPVPPGGSPSGNGPDRPRALRGSLAPPVPRRGGYDVIVWRKVHVKHVSLQDAYKTVVAAALERLAEDPDQKPAVTAVDILYAGKSSPEADKRLAQAA